MVQQVSIKRSRIVIILRAQYGANCSVSTPQHYCTKNPYHYYEAQYAVWYRHASGSIGVHTMTVLLVRVSQSQRLLMVNPVYHFHTIPTAFLTCHLSYKSLSVLRGLDGVWSSRYSRLFTSRKDKTAQTLRLHVRNGKLRSTHGCLDTEF